MLGSSEDMNVSKEVCVANQEDGDGRGEEEELWDTTDLCRNSEHRSFALDRLTSLCEYLNLTAPTTVFKSQQQAKNIIIALVDVVKPVISLRTKLGLLESVHKNLDN